jgi:hypothetical protein
MQIANRCESWKIAACEENLVLQTLKFHYMIVCLKFLAENKQTSQLLKLLLTFTSTAIPVSFQVCVALRPTVGRPVRLGVGPPLGPMARFEFSLFHSYFLSFSCRAPL